MNPESSFGNTTNIPLKPLSEPSIASENFGNTARAGGAPAEETAPKSTMVAGRYEVHERIGRGGMGVVWRGKDHRMGEDVAIKFIPDIIKSDDAAISELKSETRKGLRLTHRNIVRMIELVEDNGDDPPAIIMEYIDGPTLSSLRLKQPGQVFEVDQRLKAWMEQLLAALEYAHDTARIVHRDLKPANLMVNSAGQLKVTDFGIACSLRESVSRVSVRANNTSGTLLYMSPQQMDGNVPSEADDIYALGATFYELLTSRPPFYAGDIGKQLEFKRPPSLADRRAELGTGSQPIPEAWEAVIAACLEKEPQSRPVSIAAVRAGLAGENFERGAKTLRGSIIRPGQTMPGANTQRAQAAAASTTPSQPAPAAPAANSKWLTVGVVAAVMLGGGYFWQSSQEADRRQATERQAQAALQQAEQQKRSRAEEELARMKGMLDEAKRFEDSDSSPMDKKEKFEAVVSALSTYDYPYDDSEKPLLTAAEKKFEEWKDLIDRAQAAYDLKLAALKSSVRDADKQISGAPNLSAKAKSDIYGTVLADNSGFIEGFGMEHTIILGRLEKLVQQFEAEDKTQRPTSLFMAEQAISDPRATGWKEYGRSELIKRVQNTLLGEPNLGVAVVADGAWNQSTQDALLRYQDAKRLPPTGKIDLSTVNAMGVGAIAGGPEPTKTAPTPVRISSSENRRSGGSPSGNNTGGSKSGSGWSDPGTLGNFIRNVGASGIRPPGR